MANQKMKKISKGRRIIFVVAIVVSLATLFQFVHVFDNYSVLWLKRTYRTMSMPSMERNAINLVGSKGARYLEFLSRNITQDQPVVLPEGYGELSEQSILQFFLMPRRIPGCFCGEYLETGSLTDACVNCLLKEEHSLPAIGSFPPDGLLSREKDFIQFEDGNWYRGVYVPQNSKKNLGDIYMEMDFPVSRAIILDLFVIGLILLNGLVIGYVLDRTLGSVEYFSLAIPLSTGLLTWCIFISSWLGLKISLFMYVIYLVLPMFIFAFIKRGQALNFLSSLAGERKRESVHSVGQGRNISLVLLGGFVFLALISVVISITRGYSLFDGISNWALKGYGIALERSVFAGKSWGGHGLSYPQNIHLQIAFFRLLDGDVLPGSKILFPLFGVSLLGGCYSFLRRHSIKPSLALLHTISIFTIPIFFLHTTIGWGNLVFSAYLVLAVCYLVLAHKTASDSKYLVGGSLLAFATWTRPEGIGYAILFVLLFVTAEWLQRRRMLYRWLTPLIVISATWLTFSIQALRGDEIGDVIRNFGVAITRGEFELHQLSYILRYAWDQWTDFSTWGSLVYSLPILLLLSMILKHEDLKRSTILTVGAGVISILIPIFMFFVASFSKEDMSEFLWASFNRSQFHGLILIYTSLFLNAFSFPDETDIPGRSAIGQKSQEK
jgi:hypothetical protein